MVAFITAEDVPGENRVKGGATDGLLLAEGKVEYVGQPIALIVATTQRTAEDISLAMCSLERHLSLPV